MTTTHTTTPSNPLDFSVPFDKAKTSEAPQVCDMVDSLMAELLPTVTRSKAAYRQNLATALLNLFTAHHHHPDQYVAYSRDKGRYKAKDTRNNPLGISHRCLVACVVELEKAGYVDDAKGINYDGYRRQSRMRATDILLDVFGDYHLDLGMVERDHALVTLKNTSGKRIQYADTPKMKPMRRNLERINSYLQRVDVQLPLSEDKRHALVKRMNGSGRKKGGQSLDFTKRTLYRVFSHGRFDLGGRFYGHWVQSLPKEYRPRLTIDGEPVCEWDFSGMAVNMLYLREGLPLPEGDVYAVYTIPGRPGQSVPRPFRNKLLKIALNAETREEAVKAVAHDVHEETKDRSFTRTHASLIISRFEEKHRPIAHHFGTGVGLSLQYDDSKVAEAVMLDLLEQNIPCIPIHDSFVVKTKDGDTLRTAMEKYSKEVLGGVLPMEKKYP